MGGELSNNPNQQEIPMMRLIPFQHDANILYSIQRQDLQNFQNTLKQNNCRVMRAYRHNIMFVAHESIVAEKVYDYMLRTKAYISIADIDQRNSRRTTVRQLLDTMVEKSKCLLKNLHDCQWITSFQYEQMKVERFSVRLDYLFFVPDLHEQQDHITYEPLTISSLSPLMPLSRYLNRLLEPIYYNHIARSTTVYKGADIVKQLENYQQQGYLKSTTLFVTIHFKDLHTSIKHERLLSTLQDFLQDYITDEQRIQGMKIPAILELTRFILQNQYFIYKNDILYRQILGGSTGLYIIDLLINIYLFYWQRCLIINEGNDYEIFGRCFNDIFLTWNESEEKLQQLLKLMKIKDTSLQWDFRVQTHEIHFLDAQIHYCHRTQHLQTSVYHDWKYEPYILPKLHNAKSLSHANTLHTALIRAILCCSRLEDFDNEKQYIEYSFLFHKFSSDFIQQQMEGFFQLFNASDFSIYHEQTMYDELRRRVRQYDQEKTQETYERLENEQKQCIWYINSKLKGFSLLKAKQNPAHFLPTSYLYNSHVSDVIIKVVGVPYYPSNTI
ncbi:unnamed protein product [Adineta steineri]|uniref:Uncharacterized protein n=1 Tax=Adineta steineri TaxID=433720 RepID=A0A816A7T6_9BILA|nr:unnamed protein product [Adineta steineri]CAF1592159.1 unnamed protein product [Adineta steineri]